MGNLQSFNKPEKSLESVPAVSLLPSTQSPTTHPDAHPVPRNVEFHCFSTDRRFRSTKHSAPLKSQARDESRVGFLDLPAEIRNDIYTQLFVHDGYVRLTPQAPTRIAGMAFFRVCKQVHDEASSVLYAANSFYCTVKHEIRVQSGTKIKLREEDLREGWFPSQGGNQDREHQGNVWGVIFPAPRYQRWLTRITIDATINIIVISGEKALLEFGTPEYIRTKSTNGEWYYYLKKETPAQNIEDVAKMREDVQAVFIETYNNMQMLWGEKPEGRNWEGRLVIAKSGWPSRSTSTSTQIMISFYEGSEDEVATKRALRQRRPELQL